MMLWMKAKLTIIILAAVAVATVAGATAVLASQSHSAPSSAPRTSAGDATQQGQNEFEAQGVIQQVTFDQGSTQSGNLVFLPNGKQTTVTVVFTTATKIEEEGANGAQQNSLQAGMSAKVEGTLQADGSVLAREIQTNAKDANNNGDNGGSGGGDNGGSGGGDNGGSGGGGSVPAVAPAAAIQATDLLY